MKNIFFSPRSFFTLIYFFEWRLVFLVIKYGNFFSGYYLSVYSTETNADDVGTPRQNSNQVWTYVLLKTQCQRTLVHFRSQVILIRTATFEGVQHTFPINTESIYLLSRIYETIPYNVLTVCLMYWIPSINRYVYREIISLYLHNLVWRGVCKYLLAWVPALAVFNVRLSVT